MYNVRFYKGDYLERQQKANEDGCAGYLEYHFNGSASPMANYTVTITGSNASQTSKNWGRWYAQAVAQEFDLPLGGDRGIMVGGYNGRGDYNLRFTRMPAILLEPLFASNPQHAEWIRTDAGQGRLARILCEREADYVEAVLEKAKALIEGIEQPQQQREIRVLKGDEVIWKYAADPDADITWDPVRGVLHVEQS